MQNESPGLSRRQRSMLAYDTHPCTNINRTYSKSVTIVIWILSLARFKYVTQLNHYNHWFILITASRDPTLWLFRAHTHTHDHFSPLRVALLPTPYILSVKYFAESYFGKSFFTVCVSGSHSATKYSASEALVRFSHWNGMAATRGSEREISDNVLVLFCVPFLKVFLFLPTFRSPFFTTFYMRNHQRLTTFMHGRAP